jgi:AhpD family alkylhydroperoxidase
MSEQIDTNTKKKLDEIQETMLFLRKKYPEVTKNFIQFFQAVEKPGVLDTKTKELISLAISVVNKCSYCVPYYVHRAFEHGATTDEILESSLVAAKMGGGPGVLHIRWVIDALKDMGKI